MSGSDLDELSSRILDVVVEVPVTITFAILRPPPPPLDGIVPGGNAGRVVSSSSSSSLSPVSLAIVLPLYISRNRTPPSSSVSSSFLTTMPRVVRATTRRSEGVIRRDIPSAITDLPLCMNLMENRSSSSFSSSYWTISRSSLSPIMTALPMIPRSCFQSTICFYVGQVSKFFRRIRSRG